ncbi:uncharacterized protein palmdb isoform X2 [Gouania willdenowi]|nr:uncharacterized protein LOC114454162 isoform X2 [Gouania willdenowi]
METAEQSKLLMDGEEEGAVDNSPEENILIANDLQVCPESSSWHDMVCLDQEEVLIPEVKHDEYSGNTFSAHDSENYPCVISFDENETDFKKQEITLQDFEQEQSTFQMELSEPELCPEPEQDPEPEENSEPEQQSNLVEGCEIQRYAELLQDADEEEYPEPDQLQDLQPFPELEQELVIESFTESDQELELKPSTELELEDGDKILDPENDSHQDMALYQDELSQHYGDELVLDQCISEDVSSNMFYEPCVDPDQSETEESPVVADTDSIDKWRLIFSSSINKEDDDSYLDSLELSAQDLFVQKIEVTDCEEHGINDFEDVYIDIPCVKEAPGKSEDIYPVPSHNMETNNFNLEEQVSEDTCARSQDPIPINANDEQTVTDPTKKLPKDFCVIQETKSENVSTEHVDFQLARKQWRDMEEQTTNKIIIPTTKQPSFHGSHSFMYTPVRIIDRGHKKAYEFESLNLARDHSHTQFSPCSEDSGLEDFSSKSPHDDGDTPERNICLSLEKEENFKKERGIFKMSKSTDCAPSQNYPRSISTPLMPSFIITSSPTKEPLKHEVSANSVIILEPGSELSSHSQTGNENVPTWSGDGSSENSSSNVIILETSNLIIRSASEFSLSRVCEESQEKMFLNNPFFKLRSRSTASFVDEEIKMAKQREEELRKDRANLYGKDKFDTDKGGSNRMDTLAFSHSVDVPMKCLSSPSSPMKTTHKMNRFALSCDHGFSENCGGRRKSAMALRWEAGEFTKND